MRLGLAVFGAAVVFGGYALVNTIQTGPEGSGSEASATDKLRSWMPGAIDDEPGEVETRSYELIRYMNKDGSFGMVDDPTRVPPGATILGRERKTAAVAKQAPTGREREAAGALSEGKSLSPDKPGRTLSPAEQRLMDSVMKGGPFPDAAQLEQMQKDLDELERERVGESPDADALPAQIDEP